MLLTNLADILRAAGLNVIEVSGWQQRMRGGTGGHSTGGYLAGTPSHVMVHHTASSWSAAQDVAYLATGHKYAPVSNLYLARNGDVYVIAAGATNTNGQGGPVDGCPADSMNSRAVSIEAGNNGTGEPWPTDQQDAYVTLCAALCDAYSIPVGRVLAHFEWAPDRKIDPAGPSKWARTDDRYQRWDMDAFRGDVLQALTPAPEPPEVIDPPKETDMRYVLLPPSDLAGKPWFLRWDGTWSYLTGIDRDEAKALGLPEVRDENSERYSLVHESVFGRKP